MAQPRLKPMTADEFFVWHLAQESKYELVDGFAVPHRAMTGGTLVHSRIAANILGHLFIQLRGTSCMPMGSDTAIRTSIERVRYPDVIVDCSPPDRTNYEARNPIALFEVLSPTTRTLDLQVKLAEYMRHAGMRTIVLIEPDRMDVIVYTRDGEGQWQLVRLEKPEDDFGVAGTSARVRLLDVYEGVSFTQ